MASMILGFLVFSDGCDLTGIDGEAIRVLGAEVGANDGVRGVVGAGDDVGDAVKPFLARARLGQRIPQSLQQNAAFYRLRLRHVRARSGCLQFEGIMQCLHGKFQILAIDQHADLDL